MKDIEIIGRKILKKIKEFKRIFVFRHESPDYDALGTQFGLYTFLKENFKDKEIHATGFANVPLAPLLYPENEVLKEEDYGDDFLAIVVDTGNSKRISDQNYKKAKYIIKIDHHPAVEQYGDLNYVDDEAGSCGEVVCEILSTTAFKKFYQNDLSAKYFYSAIVGDTGRFQFPSTSSKTLSIAAELLKYNFNISEDVYYPMYVKDIKDFERQKIIMNNYKITKKGIAYYVLTSDLLKQLEMDVDESKIFLGMFQLHEGIEIWCSFAEDERNNNVRGSIRSRKYDIDGVAAKYNGGGHKQAAGCRIDSLKDVDKVIKDLEALIK